MQTRMVERTANRSQGVRETVEAMQLTPKGACWYCDKPVDQVRQFCSQTCRKDYQEEDLFFPR